MGYLTADLFINVLNNVNTMKPQEIRNAIRGKLSEFIRNSARFEKLPLFDRTYDGKVYKLKHFSHTFNLSGRVEVDEWFVATSRPPLHNSCGELD